MSFKTLAAGLFAAWISTSLLVWRIETPVPEADIRTIEDSLGWGIVIVLAMGWDSSAGSRSKCTSGSSGRTMIC